MNALHKLVVAGLLAFAGAAWGATADPVINQRQDNQADRIRQGVASGALTKPEAKRLRAEQRGIASEEKAFKADGKLSRVERRDLTRDQNRASRDIARQKHDAQTRAPKSTAPQG